MEKVNIPCSHCALYTCFACVVNSNPLKNNNYFIPAYKSHEFFVLQNSNPAEIKALINSVPTASNIKVNYILTHSRSFQMENKMDKTQPQKYFLRFSHRMERCVYIHHLFVSFVYEVFMQY
jgi:hypothetical protein